LPKRRSRRGPTEEDEEEDEEEEAQELDDDEDDVDGDAQTAVLTSASSIATAIRPRERSTPCSRLGSSGSALAGAAVRGNRSRSTDGPEAP
jgi:hypothetical protein